MSKRILSILLAIAFGASLIPTTLSADWAGNYYYNDVDENHWANGVIAQWSGDGYGVLQGADDDGDGAYSFMPSKGLTLGELATILAKSFGYAERTAATVTPAWADEYVEKAIAAGVIAKADTIDANAVVTREQAIKHIALAYNIAPAAGDSVFADNADISAEYKPYVNAFHKLGYIVGRGGGVFDPKAYYTRAEAMQVIDNTTSEITDKSITGQTYEKNLIVRKSGVTVKDTTVKGDLIIGQGVGDGEVTLDNVALNGRLLALGGGSSSVIIKGGKVIQSTVANKTFGETLHLNGTFNTITVTAGTKVTVTGTVTKLILLGDNDVPLNGAAVTSVTASGDNVKFVSNSGSSVGSVAVSANRVAISGDGEVKNVSVAASAKSGVEVLTAPTKVTVDANAGAVKTKNGLIQPGVTKTTSNPSIGGGSGGGNASSSTSSSGGGGTPATPVTPVTPVTPPQQLFGVTLDTSGLTALDEANSVYFVENKLDALSGTIARADLLASLGLKISVGDLVIADKALTIGDTWSISEPPLLLGRNELIITATGKNGFVVTRTVVILNYSEDNSEDIVLDDGDTDGDGIPNYVERFYGTTEDNADTDSDGLSDYDEIALLGTDPLKADSDGNGISDYDEDFDNDSLSNGYEVANGLNPFSADSDSDGLNDADEIDIGVNPVLADTDGDGASDGWEIDNARDPLKADSSFNVSKKSEDVDKVNAGVEITLSGEQVETLAIEQVNDKVLFNEAIPGYIGAAYDFSVDGEFDSAIIKFEFDEELSLDPAFDPVIYYFNPDTQLLEEMPTAVDGNVASAVVTHFSTYILLNKTLYDQVWDRDIKRPDDAREIDIVFVIDYSYSMTWNDPSGIRKTVSSQFIEKLGEDDRGAVVGFMNRAWRLAELTSDGQALTNAVYSLNDDNGYTIYSGTNGSDGLGKALDILDGTDRESRTLIVFLTDGEDTTNSYSYDYLIGRAQAQNTSVYTVGLGDSLNEELLQMVAAGTGGIYYHATLADELVDIYTDIEGETIDYATDSNNDGISDYFTRLLCDGTLTTGTGTPLFDGISFEDVQANDDYDGDGLKNGEEIIVSRNDEDERVYLKLISSPCLADTDGDGIEDKEDTSKLTKGLADGVIGALKICSYGTGPSSFEDFNGHSFVAYTSFVNDSAEFYGIKVDSYKEVAKSNGDTRADRAKYNKVSFTPDTVATIGDWADWLPDRLKGSWINNELWLYDQSGVPADQRSLTRYVTQRELDKIETLTEKRCKWTDIYNCSSFAVDVWNETFDDNLSAKGSFIYQNPASLSSNIEKRAGYEIGGSLLADRP
ncbi:MAG: VWA domain-containing protein [Clostridiales bacterium]|nr:VWA domain-containing protein [Clostridiales bacterium]